jgi:predicted phosphohydrolase
MLLDRLCLDRVAGMSGNTARDARHMRFVCVSDTHGMHDRLPMPPGDVFLFAGDMLGGRGLDGVRSFAAFLRALPHRHKLVIAGNHDFPFQREPGEARALLAGCCAYLEDSEAVVEGVRVYGSPWQPWFFDWAFNLERGEAIRRKWDLIPEEVDILLTHGPAAGHGDAVDRGRNAGQRVGCADLLDALRRVRPKVHVFGHIHEGYGETREGGTRCLNVSMCDVDYTPVNDPVVFDYP